jgi:hypothetical protein
VTTKARLDALLGPGIRETSLAEKVASLLAEKREILAEPKPDTERLQQIEEGLRRLGVGA